MTCSCSVSDPLFAQLQQRARAWKSEAFAVYLAAKDPRTPWYARGLIFLVAAHTFSPIDLIPDFIPVLGYLDDLIIIPAGLWLAVRMIPAEVLAEAWVTAAGMDIDGSVGKIGAAVTILLWIVGLSATVYLILRIVQM